MEPDTSQEREIRAARNQAMFRAVNEKIRELNEAFAAAAGTFTMACECADATCLAMIEIAPADYEAIRADPRRFAVLHGHLDADIEDVVAEADGYQVAEKRGEAAATVSALTLPQGGVDGN